MLNILKINLGIDIKNIIGHKLANELYEISKYLRYDKCESCNGYRLKNEAQSVKINNLHIGEISAFTIENAIVWFENLEKKLTKTQYEIARRILKEINDRLNFLKKVIFLNSCYLLKQLLPP